MMTFLPYPSFVESADCLDWQYSHNRLNNQINEAFVLAQYLLGIRDEKHYRHNPHVLNMWRGYELVLIDYTVCCLLTWERKKKHINQERHEKVISLQSIAINNGYKLRIPPWLGNEKLHSSHRSALLGKLPEWYSQFGWSETPAVWSKEKGWGYYYPGLEQK